MSSLDLGNSIECLKELTIHPNRHQQKGLEIPHPGIAERSFVLAPMSEIAPEFIHPKLKRSIQALLMEIPNPQQVNRLSSDG